MIAFSRRLLGAAAAAGLTALFAPRAAHACTGPLGYACSGAGAAVAPANESLFVVRSPWEPTATSLVRSALPPGVRLLGATGAPVPFSLTPDGRLAGTWLVRPQSAVAAGERYSLAWDSSPSCPPVVPSGDAGTSTLEFAVPAAAPRPTALGTVSLRPAVRRAHTLTSCDVPMPAFDEVVVPVTLALSPELQPYAGLVVVELTVDGVVVEALPWAVRAVAASGMATTAPNGSEGASLLVASCTRGVDTGISPGPHRVGFRATIAGLPTILVADALADFDCAATSPTPADAGPGVGGSPEASPGPSAPSSAGCSVVPVGPRSSPREPAFFLVAAVGAVAIGLRRQSACRK